ncbi:hypothetical protein J6590_085277 [Homalodisca vitripennis]|nr:hypothetical protein J6590_085277 [Homalodisca vitripennis]
MPEFKTDSNSTKVSLLEFMRREFHSHYTNDCVSSNSSVAVQRKSLIFSTVSQSCSHRWAARKVPCLFDYSVRSLHAKLLTSSALP